VHAKGLINGTIFAMYELINTLLLEESEKCPSREAVNSGISVASEWMIRSEMTLYFEALNAGPSSEAAAWLTSRGPLYKARPTFVESARPFESHNFLRLRMK
jgi:hypothetical protein